MAVESKNIFITGSTDGIGKMLAIEFAKKGANISAHGRNSKTLDSLYDALEEQGNGKHLIIEAIYLLRCLSPNTIPIITRRV